MSEADIPFVGKTEDPRDPAPDIGRNPTAMTTLALPHLEFATLVTELGNRIPDFLAVAGRPGKSRSTSGTVRDTGRPLPTRAETPVTDHSSHIPVSDLTRSDEELLVAYRSGETEAFAILVDRYRNELVHFLQRFLGSRAAADDVFQDAFLQVHLSADSFDADRRFKPWLYTIAANKARDFHRRRRRRAAVSLSSPVGGADGRETSLVDLLAGDDSAIDAHLLDEEKQRLVKQVVDDTLKNGKNMGRDGWKYICAVVNDCSQHVESLDSVLDSIASASVKGRLEGIFEKLSFSIYESAGTWREME